MVVALKIRTEEPAPAANTPKSHPNVWLPTGPLMAQVPGLGLTYAGLMLQLTPVPAGRGAFRVVAVGGVAWFKVKIVNDIGEPAATGVPPRCTVVLTHGASFGE